MLHTYRNITVMMGGTLWLTCCVLIAGMSTNHGWQPTSTPTAGSAAAAIAWSITNGSGVYAGLALLVATYATAMFGTPKAFRYLCRTMLVATTVTTGISTLQGYVPWMIVLVAFVSGGFDLANKLRPNETAAQRTKNTA